MPKWKFRTTDVTIVNTRRSRGCQHIVWAKFQFRHRLVTQMSSWHTYEWNDDILEISNSFEKSFWLCDRQQHDAFIQISNSLYQKRQLISMLFREATASPWRSSFILLIPKISEVHHPSHFTRWLLNAPEMVFPDKIFRFFGTVANCSSLWLYGFLSFSRAPLLNYTEVLFGKLN